MARKYLSPLNLLNLTSDPGTATEGDFYWNSSSNKLRIYFDGAWGDANTLPSNIAYKDAANTFTTAQTITPATSVTGLAINGATSAIGLIVKANATSPLDMTQWQNSGGTVLSVVDFAGRVGLRTGGSVLSSTLAVSPSSASAVAVTIRGVASQTANLQEWQNSAGTVLAAIDSNFNGFFGNQITLGRNRAVDGASFITFNTVTSSGTQASITRNSGFNGALTLQNFGNSTILFQNGQAGSVVTTVRGFASQTANLQEWQNSSGTVLSSIDSNGQGSFKSTTLTASSSSGSALTLVAAGGQTADLLTTAGGAKIPAAGNYFIAPGIYSTFLMYADSGSATQVAVRVKGFASQTANLQEWQSSAGSVLTAINSNGRILTNQRISIGFPVATPVVTAHSNFGNDTDAARVVALFRGAASQTANLQEWQNSAGTILSSINSSGHLSTSKINFTGGTTTISAQTLADGTVSFEGTAGQLFSVSNSLTGTIFAINDISGLPSVEVTDLGIIKLNELYGQTVVGSGTPATNAQLSAISRTASTISLAVRGAASQTANLQEWQQSDTTVPTAIDSTGKLRVRTFGYMAGASLDVSTASVGNAGIVVRGVASQTADLQQWQNSAGTALAKVDSIGSIFTASSNTQGLYIYSSADQTQISVNRNPATGTILSSSYPAAIMLIRTQLSDSYFQFFTSNANNSYGSERLRITSGGLILVNSTSSTLGGGSVASQLGIISGAATTVGAVVRGATSQSANLQEWQDSSGSVLASISSAGVLDTATIRTNNITGSGGSVNRMQFGGTTFNALIPVVSSTYVGLGIRGASSQSANLQEWQNSGGTVLASVSSAGAFTIPSLTISGDLTVNGTTTNINSTNLVVEDKNIILGDVTTPSNTTADGGGITLKGATDKTFNWVNSTGYWTSNVGLEGSSIVRTGGTSSQFLKADGSVDSSTYLTTGTASSTYAPIASPSLTGTPTAPTASSSVSSTQIATTAYVKSLFTTDSTSGTLDWNDVSNTRPGVGPTLLLGSATNGPGGGNYYHPFNIEYAGTSGTGNVTQLAIGYGTPGNEIWMRGRYQGTWSSWVKFAVTNSPTFTGTPLSTTAAADTNTTQIATTAFVIGQASSSNPIALGTVAAGTSLKYARADHVHPTTGLALLTGAAFTGAVTSSFTGGTAHFSATNTSNANTEYNLILSGVNDTGTKAVHFVNSSTRTTDGGVSAYTIRNDGGVLNLGNASYQTNLLGSAIVSSAQIQSTLAGSTANGQIYLNGATSNRIDFNSNGVAAPAFTTRSAGTKILLYPSISASSADYAIGIEGSTLWTSVPSTSQQFKWYAGTTQVASLNGSGLFTAVSKSFDIEHPTKPDMRLRYGSLEGPENGVYVRGNTKENVIKLPEYWTGLVDESTITVSLTSVGKFQKVYLEKIEGNKIYIGGRVKEISYVVFGERKDIDKITVEY